MTRPSHRMWFFAPATAVFCLVVLGRPPAGALADGPPGQTRLDKVRQAYQTTRQYQGRARITITRRQGRWLEVDEGTMQVAFDRPSRRLKINTPDLLVVRDRKQLRASSSRFAGQHLETTLPKRITYRKLVDEVPMLGRKPVVDAVFLLADHPVSVLSAGQATTATPLAPAKDDSQARPRLRFDTGRGRMTLGLNPKTWLIERATLRTEASRFGGQPGDYVRMRFDIEVVKHNEPIDADQFKFDAQNTTAVASLGRSGSGVGQGGTSGSADGGSAQGGGGGDVRINKPAPDFTLKDLSGNKRTLSDVDDDVVVLTFWASWAPPCRKVLPALEQIRKWADKDAGRAEDDDKAQPSIKILTINTGQSSKQIKAFCDANNMTLPVLLDDFTVAEKYGMVTVPLTVMICEGKIRFIQSGPSDDYVRLYKKQIQTLLANHHPTHEGTKP